MRTLPAQYIRTVAASLSIIFTAASAGAGACLQSTESKLGEHAPEQAVSLCDLGRVEPGTRVRAVAIYVPNPYDGPFLVGLRCEFKESSFLQVVAPPGTADDTVSSLATISAETYWTATAGVLVVDISGSFRRGTTGRPKAFLVDHVWSATPAVHRLGLAR